MRNKQISIAFQTDKTASEYIALAKLVNQFDFDVVSVYCDAPYHPSYGPLLLMAPHLKRAKIGPAAVSPFRIHPIDIAANTALLATLAPGRTYVGLARGAWLGEHGIRKPGKPLTGIREAIGIIQSLLNGVDARLEGEVFSIDGFKAPYPLPDRFIPLMIGTWGKKLAQLAGELADEVKIGGSANPAMVPYLRKEISAGADRAGRPGSDIGVVMGAVTVVDQDRRLARNMARRQVAMYLPVVLPLDPTLQIDPELVQRIQIAVKENDLLRASDLISDEVLDMFAFSGSPTDIIYQASNLFDVGVNRIEFGTPHGLKPFEGIKLLGRSVLPATRK